MLYRKKNGLAGFGLDIYYQNYQYLDPTGVYNVVHKQLISVRPVVKKERTFEINKTFIIVMLAFCIAFACLSVIAERVYGTNTINRFVGEVFKIISILFFESVRCTNLRLINTIILGLWIVYCFSTIFNFFGEMTSTAIVDKHKTTYINTLENMKERNISWISLPSINMDYVLNRKLPEQAKYKKTMPLKEGLEFMMQNPFSHVFVLPKVAVNPLIRLLFWDGKGKNPFYFSPPILGDRQISLTVLVGKDSPYSRDMTKKILQIDASGVYKHKYIPDTNDLMGKIGKPKNRRPDEDDVIKYEKVSLRSLSLYLYVWLSMLSLAILVFIVELVSLPVMRFIKRIRNRRGRVWSGVQATALHLVTQEKELFPVGPVAQDKELHPIGSVAQDNELQTIGVAAQDKNFPLVELVAEN